MAPTRYDLRAWGRMIKTIFKNFPDIYAHLGTNLHYIPIVISKSAHPSILPAGRYLGIYRIRSRTKTFWDTVGVKIAKKLSDSMGCFFRAE
jgi:hypothetical protein